MQGVDVFDMKPLDASRKGTALFYMTTVKSFILEDHTTPVGSICANVVRRLGEAVRAVAGVSFTGRGEWKGRRRRRK